MSDPRVAQVTTGRFHQFDLARQLERRGLLMAMVTAYPRWKLRGEGLPAEKLHTFPWVHAPFMKLGGRLPPRWGERWSLGSQRVIDGWAERVLRPRPEVLIAMSGHGLKVGGATRAGGGAWVCVRGSTHVRAQARVLSAAYARWSLPWRAPLELGMRREEAEYAMCDRIAVPSRVVWDSFLAEGVPAEKLALVPYGADPQRFFPEGERGGDGVFRVVCVGTLGVRKGTARLVEAFARLRVARKELVLVGAATPEWAMLAPRLPLAGVRVEGAVSATEVRAWLGRADVFALASVEEGLANVVGQAMACGCPVVATAATGAAELIEPGREGFVLSEADMGGLAEKLEWLANRPGERVAMGRAARAKIESLGGWDAYGDRMEALVRELALGRDGR